MIRTADVFEKYLECRIDNLVTDYVRGREREESRLMGDSALLTTVSILTPASLSSRLHAARVMQPVSKPHYVILVFWSLDCLPIPPQ